MRDGPEDIAAVRGVLQEFQDGYTRRDLVALDAVMSLFTPGEELEVIGTNASNAGQDEWCLGPASVRTLMESDWRTWGDLRLDVAGSRIHCLGDTAWLACQGTVSQHIETEQAYRDYLAYINTLVAQDKPAEERTLRIMLGCATTLYELHRGEEFTWPLRFTAVLAREDGRWLFQQMQFSYPTTRFPDERVVE